MNTLKWIAYFIGGGATGLALLALFFALLALMEGGPWR